MAEFTESNHYGPPVKSAHPDFRFFSRSLFQGHFANLVSREATILQWQHEVRLLRSSLVRPPLTKVSADGESVIHIETNGAARDEV